jgi:WS/DGAT/MGAT family acyltransferase
MSGSDAALWHMEDRDTPLHTLKVVILDPARRGRQLTLDELALAVGSRLGLVPRSTQKVGSVPGFGARPFWVDDPDFALRDHLDERTLPAGDATALDALYGELASTFLPADRSPWAMTLVHGLEGGRQAVVVRVHHAIVDGLGALNAFLAATTEVQGDVVEIAPAATAEPTSRARLTITALLDAVRTLLLLPALGRAALAARRGRRPTERDADIPKFMTFRRSSLNAGSGSARVCASGSLDLQDMRAIAKVTGTTVNGVLHAAIAGALREELLARGEDVSEPCRAAFGIATDTSDADRTHGNHVTPTFVHLRSDLDDPVARLEATARSCRAAVEARREAGLDLSDRFAALAPRLLNAVRRVLTRTTSMNPSHIVTANVPGAKGPRWFGDIEVVDWFSFAIAVNPANINLTVHSYDGRMNVGLVADPAALPCPSVLVDRLVAELRILAEAVRASEATTQVA